MAKVTKTLSCLFISLFLFATYSEAQKKQEIPGFEDEEELGLTIGVNLEGPIGLFFDTDKTAFSALTQIKFAPSWFFRGEAGFENIRFSPENRENRNYAYESNGTFLRAGVLYDFFEVDERGNNDNIFIGLNYGFALQNHSSDSYTIENGYWDDYRNSRDNYVMNSHWLEVCAGPRTELLENFYMGWTINLRMKMFQGNAHVLEPYSIPGYGKGDNDVNLGFSYVFEYFIPW